MRPPARERGLRLNHLVGQLADGLELDIGFTAALRLFCLSEALTRLRSAEEQIADLSLSRGTTDVAAIVGACPAPCIMINQDRLIMRVNEAFIRWLGASHEELQGQPLDRFFQIRGHFRLPELWARFGRGYTKPVAAKLAYVAPGRVIVAKAQLCATVVNGPDDFCCLIMLEHRPGR
jgi:PAS domain-containing protein